MKNNIIKIDHPIHLTRIVAISRKGQKSKYKHVKTISKISIIGQPNILKYNTKIYDRISNKVKIRYERYIKR